MEPIDEFQFATAPSEKINVDPAHVFYQSQEVGIVGALPQGTALTLCGDEFELVVASSSDSDINELNRDLAPVDLNRVQFPKKSDLNKITQEKITNVVNPDCIVEIDNQKFQCHLLVLVSYSTYFSNRLPENTYVLPADKITPDVFSAIYNWMILPEERCHSVFDRNNILALHYGTQFLGIQEMEDQCWAFMLDEDVFSEDTALILYLQARNVGNTTIMDLMQPRINHCFLPLVSSPDYMHLPVDFIETLLKSNYIVIHCEMEVFMSAIKWLFHNYVVRREYTLTLMKCVRFGLISPWQLVDIQRNAENPEFLEVMAIPEVQTMLEDGLAYAVNRCRYEHNTPEYCIWRDKLGLHEPDARNWVGSNRMYHTYDQFLHVLEQYKEMMVRRNKLFRLRLRDAAIVAMSNVVTKKVINNKTADCSTMKAIEETSKKIYKREANEDTTNESYTLKLIEDKTKDIYKLRGLEDKTTRNVIEEMTKDIHKLRGLENTNTRNVIENITKDIYKLHGLEDTTTRNTIEGTTKSSYPKETIEDMTRDIYKLQAFEDSTKDIYKLQGFEDAIKDIHKIKTIEARSKGSNAMKVFGHTCKWETIEERYKESFTEEAMEDTPKDSYTKGAIKDKYTRMSSIASLPY